MSNLLSLEQIAFNSFKPPKKLSLSDWADEYAYLSAESSQQRVVDGKHCHIKKG